MAYMDDLREAGFVVYGECNTIIRFKEALHRDVALFYDEDTQNWVVEVESVGWPGHWDELFRSGTSLQAITVMERIMSAVPYIEDRGH